MDIILKINQLLEEKKISRNQLAKLIGKNPSTLHYMLIGKSRMDIETFIKICNALDVSPCEFFETEQWEDDPNFEMLKLYEYFKYLQFVPPMNNNKFLYFDYWYLLLLNFFMNWDARDEYFSKEVILTLLKEQMKLAFNFLKTGNLKEREKKILRANIGFVYKVYKAANDEDVEKLNLYKRRLIDVISKKIKQYNEFYAFQLNLPETMSKEFERLVEFDSLSMDDIQKLNDILNKMIKDDDDE